MKLRLTSSLGVFAIITSATMLLTGCGSDDSSTHGQASHAIHSTESCPTTPPQENQNPEWTLSGETGTLDIVGSTDKQAPLIKLAKPFSVTHFESHTLHEGDGPIISSTATLLVCYVGVNGRDGSVFDSSYRKGKPAQLSVNHVIPGFQKALLGKKVGSIIAAAIPPAEGYPQGQPKAGIAPGDTLIFEIRILKLLQ